MTSGIVVLDVRGDVLERNSGEILVLAHLFFTSEITLAAFILYGLTL